MVKIEKMMAKIRNDKSSSSNGTVKLLNNFAYACLRIIC